MAHDVDLATTTAAELAAALRSRQVSAAETIEASIARIEALDPSINAVIVRDFERARAEAKAADLALAAGTVLPLLGVPMTVKESYDIKGHPTTWGLNAHRDHRAREDSLVVQRLRAAGAIILGKTNVPPLLADWQADNPVYGRTNNPHDPARSPGGSSGGSAAAIAMGFSALEMGSDIGGSVRVPAALCGVFGHKTTFGVIPMGGHAPGGAVGEPQHLSVLGPLARSAADLDLALGVVAGPDALSPANQLALPPPRRKRLADYRVLVLDHHPAAAVDAAIRNAVTRLADRLVSAGANVAHQSSLLPDLSASFRTYQAILHTVVTRRASNSREPISAHAWLDRLDEQHRLRRQWAEFFSHFDIVIAPAFSTTAFPHQGEPDQRKRSLIVDGQPVPYGSQLAWASMATVGNLPSTTIPLGLDSGGLPLAVQAIGPHLEDRTTIAFAGLVAEPIATPALAR